jgi:hypothetical protein
MGHFLSGQETQFLIYQRKQLIRRPGIALLDCSQNAGNIAHGLYFLLENR